MMNSHEMETRLGFDSPPFLYEIRVRGRLSSEQWAEWFDDLTVTVDEGESAGKTSHQEYSQVDEPACNAAAIHELA